MNTYCIYIDITLYVQISLKEVEISLRRQLELREKDEERVRTALR